MTGGIYIISKTKHAERWRNLRHAGYPIISRWIDKPPNHRRPLRSRRRPEHGWRRRLKLMPAGLSAVLPMPHYTLTLSGRMTLALVATCIAVGFILGRLI
jgi:hypothetical protein